MAAVAVFLPCWFISFAIRSFLLTCFFFSVFDFFRCRCYKDVAAPHCIPLFCESVYVSIDIAFAVWLWALNGRAWARKYVIARPFFARLFRACSFSDFSFALRIFHKSRLIIFCWIFFNVHSFAVYCPLVYRCSVASSVITVNACENGFSDFSTTRSLSFHQHRTEIYFHVDCWANNTKYLLRYLRSKLYLQCKRKLSKMHVDAGETKQHCSKVSHSIWFSKGCRHDHYTAAISMVLRDLKCKSIPKKILWSFFRIIRRIIQIKFKNNLCRFLHYF